MTVKGENEMSSKETHEQRRERLRQTELRNNPGGSIQGSGLQDLVGGLGWKGTGVLIIVLIIGALIYLTIFN